MGYRIAAPFLLFSLFSSFSFAAPVQKNIADWQVTCNNQNFCSARNIGGHHGLVMTLSRSAGAHTDVNLRIDFGSIENAGLKASPIAPRLLLDGEPLTLELKNWLIMPHHLATDDAGAINTLLNKVSHARAITLRDGAGSIALDGLQEVLVFIDNQQRRSGSETAWIKKGDDPPLSVPPAPALKKIPVINPTPTPLTQNELNDLLEYGSRRISNSQCSLDPARREVRIFALSDDKALLLIDCEAGAYNVVDLAWIVSRQKPFSSRPVRLKLPFVPAVSGSQMLELMNAGFDEKNKELTTLAKGRGIADCGVATRWRYDGQRFRLTRYAEEPACDGWHGAATWPTLWVTR